MLTLLPFILLQALLCMSIFSAGRVNLYGDKRLQYERSFVCWGYPVWFCRFAGAYKMVCALGLVLGLAGMILQRPNLPVFGVISAAFMVVYYLIAVYTEMLLSSPRLDRRTANTARKYIYPFYFLALTTTYDDDWTTPVVMLTLLVLLIVPHFPRTGSLLGVLTLAAVLVINILRRRKHNLNDLQGMAYYTFAQSRRVLRIRRKRLWQLIDSGQLPAYQFGPETLLRRADVNALPFTTLTT